MTKKTIFHDSFLVCEIMCHKKCGAIVEGALHDVVKQLKQQKLLPIDAEMVVDAEPQTLGIHRLFITIESDDQTVNPDEELTHCLAAKFREQLTDLGRLSTDEAGSQDTSPQDNWQNMFVNGASMVGILILSMIYPPSFLLTIGLTSLSFLTTAFTARNYLFPFWRNVRNGNFTGMTTTVSLGWLLSLAHTLYHAISMPLASSFSMIFMNFIMPVMLITLINGMDEINRLVLHKSKKMYLKGMKALFPQMAAAYPCYQLSEAEQAAFLQLVTISEGMSVDAFSSAAQTLFATSQTSMQDKGSLKKGTLLQVERGACFPVDCTLIMPRVTLVDASVLTGEPQQHKQCLDFIPAGAINLSQKTVTVCATENSYNSTVNQLLFRANRKQIARVAQSNSRFTYFYTTLVVAGSVVSILIPVSLGVATVSMILQSIIGIFFFLCPCTVAIAHELPKALSSYQRGKKGIVLRNGALLTGRSDDKNEIHTVVLDKTGTLTTGNSQVESCPGISPSVLQRVYLLEKQYGAKHPLATAITSYYEKNNPHHQQSIILQHVSNPRLDEGNRGLSACVQGRKIDLGSATYLQGSGVELPEAILSITKSKENAGYTVVYVAEEGVYQGFICIEHEVRSGILVALKRFKKEGKKLIMLTGDSPSSAKGFNQQHGEEIFVSADIQAGKTPQDKEAFLKEFMKGKNPKGVWFVGDGLNDAPVARQVSARGGISCSMNSTDKAAFFTDISLKGSLTYLFAHHQLNRFLQKNITQNQGLLLYSMLAFIAFIISFSIVGIPVSPLIPAVLMVSTTVFTLLNCYRVTLSVDCALDKHASWLKQALVSDWSIGLVVSASTLLIVGLLISIVASNGLTLLAFSFTAGGVSALSSACVVSGGVIFGVLALLTTGYVFTEGVSPRVNKASAEQTKPSPIKRQALPPYPMHSDDKGEVYIRDRLFQPSPEKVRYFSQKDSSVSEPYLQRRSC